MRLSVIIPAFNEAPVLATTVGSLLSALRSADLEHELIIVDDGSSDGTGALADRLAAEQRAVTALHQANLGIGGAFLAGARRARGEHLLLWPADMPATAASLGSFIDRLDTADIVIGFRRRRLGYNALMRLNAALYAAVLRTVCGMPLKDFNWLCAYRRELLLSLPLAEKGVPLLAEILLSARDAGARWTEVECPMLPRTSGRSSASRPRVMWQSLAGLVRLCARFHRTGLRPRRAP